jgi:hypothetical protein
MNLAIHSDTKYGGSQPNPLKLPSVSNFAFLQTDEGFGGAKVNQ